MPAKAPFRVKRRFRANRFQGTDRDSVATLRPGFLELWVVRA